MTPYIITIVSCTILGIGHVGWAIVHPFRVLSSHNVPTVVAASLHACWYHISIVFLMTAGLLIWHLTTAPVPLDVLAVMWVLIFLFYLPYWGALLRYPEHWRVAWFQMVLIPILLACFAYGLWAEFR